MSLAIEFASTLLYAELPFICRNYLFLAQLCHTRARVCVPVFRHTNGNRCPLCSGSRWESVTRKGGWTFCGDFVSGEQNQVSELRIALESPHPPAYGAGNQNTESKRKDKQNLPLFLPFANNVICITLSTLHLVCLGLSSARNKKTKQIFTSKDTAFCIYLYVICLLNFIYLFLLFISLLTHPKVFFQ